MEIKELCKTLLARGIKRVEISYSGSGDSGDIDTVTAYSVDEEDEQDERSGLEPAKVTLPLFEPEQNGLGEWATTKLDEAGIDWYNNEGGIGVVYLDCDKLKARIEHDYYETITVHDTRDDVEV